MLIEYSESVQQPPDSSDFVPLEEDLDEPEEVAELPRSAAELPKEAAPITPLPFLVLLLRVWLQKFFISMTAFESLLQIISWFLRCMRLQFPSSLHSWNRALGTDQDVFTKRVRCTKCNQVQTLFVMYTWPLTRTLTRSFRRMRSTSAFKMVMLQDAASSSFVVTDSPDTDNLV